MRNFVPHWSSFKNPIEEEIKILDPKREEKKK
jgi:hypothetical protein